jgi:8-oxo-dGTP pyrophosphatase MutT (NUDIX family)
MDAPPAPTSADSPPAPAADVRSSAPADARPAPGEEYNSGPPTPPRQAATVILLRGDDRDLELLLVKRNPRARFMGGVWVFPGGAVDHATDRAPGDEDDSAHRAAAVRELREEADVALGGPAELVKFSRWITPAQVRTRFDTHFYLAPLPAGQEPRVDGQECVDLDWFAPHAALEAHRREQIALVFPTIKHLEQLRPFASAAALLEHARGLTVEPVHPKVVLCGEVARVLLPGEPGY